MGYSREESIEQGIQKERWLKATNLVIDKKHSTKNQIKEYLASIKNETEKKDMREKCTIIWRRL